jgi:transcriptional regulator with XRE-family HTH domain
MHEVRRPIPSASSVAIIAAVPRRRTAPTPLAKTPLAKARLKAGITQEQMAAWVGISLRNYRRLEQGTRFMERDYPAFPSLSLFVNCALVLRVPFDEVAPPNWQKTWTTWHNKAPTRPPSKRELDKERQRWDDIRHD